MIAVEEFDCGDIYNKDFSIQQIFEMSIVPYQVNAFLRGFSTCIFTFGASDSGKDVLISGPKKEPGILLLFADAVFKNLERKKFETNNSKSSNESYNYHIRIRYVEILDEEIIDLLAPP